MKSTDKVWDAIEEVQNADDQELAEMFSGAPASLVRMGVGVLSSMIPDDPAQLDLFLTQVGDFCHSLRSDPDET